MVQAEGNRLDIGQSRVGLMVDGLPETPRVAVKLERTERQVEVTIPFLDGRSDPYRYWFSSGTVFGDDPSRTKRRYEPPDSISFHDAFGPVGLVRSRDSGSRQTFGGVGLGEGRLAFDYTVLGARSSKAYESINGMRSEVEGLGTWIGLRSLNADQEFSENGRLKSVNLRLQSPPPIRVARRLNAELQANWRYGPGPGPDQTTISERMQIRTHVRAAADWEEHLGVHFAVRDLLRVATWRRLNFVSHEVVSSSDAPMGRDGTTGRDRWLPVITYLTGISTTAPARLNSPDFLFTFPEIGSTGVGRWIAYSRKYERGLGPLVGLLDLEGASLEAHLAQVGIGFELLGYDLLRASGVSKTKADDKSWEERVRAVTSLTKSVLPFSEVSFVDLLRRNYRAVKHADKAQPDWREMQLSYLQAIQVLRAWVAIQLGVSRETLKTALDRDRISQHVKSIQPPSPSSA